MNRRYRKTFLLIIMTLLLISSVCGCTATPTESVAGSQPQAQTTTIAPEDLTDTSKNADTTTVATTDAAPSTTTAKLTTTTTPFTITLGDSNTTSTQIPTIGVTNNQQDGASGMKPPFSLPTFEGTYLAARSVYLAANNVYTGKLMSIKLYEEGGYYFTDTYAIRVKVDEVYKGNFKPGQIVDDLCSAGFSDVGSNYLFMTGLNPSYGYNEKSYIKADDVYSGEVLNIELVEPEHYYGVTVLYKVKIKVNKVYKGDYKAGQIVEDITAGRLEEIRDDVVLMTTKSDEIYDHQYGQYRLRATNNIYTLSGQLYTMVKLLDNNQIEFSRVLDDNCRYQYEIQPPKTKTELINQMTTPTPPSQQYYDRVVYVPNEEENAFVFTSAGW